MVQRARPSSGLLGIRSRKNSIAVGKHIRCSENIDPKMLAGNGLDHYADMTVLNQYNIPTIPCT